MIGWICALKNKLWTSRHRLDALSHDLNQVQERQALSSLHVRVMANQALVKSHQTIKAAHAAMVIVAGRK